MEYWNAWHKTFPGKLRLVTLTKGGQLRLWFGEPASIEARHVDSCGRNLLAHISDDGRGNTLLLRLFAENLLQKHEFSKTTVNDVEVWRITP